MVSAISPIRPVLPFVRGNFSPVRTRKIAKAFSLYNNLSSITTEILKEPIHFHPINSVFTANTLQDKPYTAPDETTGLYNFNRFFANPNRLNLNLKSKSRISSVVSTDAESALAFNHSDENKQQSSDIISNENLNEDNHINTQDFHIADSKEFFMQKSLFEQLYKFLGKKEALPPYFNNAIIAYNFN